MIVQLSKALEEFVRDSVRSGRYATEEEMVRDALERMRDEAPPAPATDLFGAMRDYADLLEDVTREVMEGRRGRTLRPLDE